MYTSTVGITYLGQCGFLLEGNGARIVTDPYLSDYVDRTCYTESTPWKRLYPAPTTLQALHPDVVLISHAHEDHMDMDTLSAYVQSGGQAPLAAPAPECGRLQAIGAQHILPARSEQPFEVKGVRITPIPCAHTQLHTDEAGRFHELSYLIDFGQGNVIFFGGDMSLYDGLQERLKQTHPALLLLPVNGRDQERTSRGIIGNITAQEAALLSAALNAPYIPMHHDLYAINGCPMEQVNQAARQAGASIYPLQPMGKLTLQNGRIQG